jgi:hypothetical protein
VRKKERIGRRSALPKRSHHLFFEDLFNLAGLLFYFSFSLVKLAFQLVLRTLFHSLKNVVTE